MTKPADLVQETLDLLILKTLALQPMHGWGIAQRFRQVSVGILQVNQGALYPALHRLEQQGWIRAKWSEPCNNRRAKFYSLTPDGVRCLGQEQAQWKPLSLALITLLIYVQEMSSQVPDAVPTPSKVMPFELGSGFLVVVEGQIGPLTRLKFILDTGATHTMVDAKIADRLGLALRKGQVLNFDKDIQMDWTYLPELHLGPLTARNFPATAGNLKRISEFAEGVDAIAGLDLLSIAESIRIDYRSHLVTIKGPAADLGVSPKAGAITVLVPLQGQPACLFLDTGLQGLLLYEDRLQRHLPHLKLSGRISRAYAGRLRGHAATLTGIHLGAEDLQSSVLLLPKAPASIPDDIDGYLGTNMLHAEMIELNFARHALRWQ